MPSIKPDWYCIVNPHAGSGKTLPQWARAEKYLTSRGIQYKTTLTNYRFHAMKLAYEAAQHGYRKILSVGGDGSVHETLCGIMQYVDESGTAAEDFTLAVIPIGSGNDWIKSTGVPHDMMKVVDLISEESFTRQDIVRVETPEGVSYMANIGGVGFDSQVCMRVNSQKDAGRRSRMIYLDALVHTVLNLGKFHARVIADGEVAYDGIVYSIAFGNGKYSGSGMRQVPLAVMDDGLLDYMIVPPVPLLRIIRELPRLFTGTLYKTDCLVMGKCREISVECASDPSSEHVEIDGEVLGTLPVSIKVTGQQINVLTGHSL